MKEEICIFCDYYHYKQICEKNHLTPRSKCKDLKDKSLTFLCLFDKSNFSKTDIDYIANFYCEMNHIDNGVRVSYINTKKGNPSFFEADLIVDELNKDVVVDFSDIKILYIESDITIEEFNWLVKQFKKLELLLTRNINQFTSLPESIGNLKNLRFLEISNSQLISLPESI